MTRLWDKGSGIWGSLNLDSDFAPKKKPAETTIKVSGEAPLLLCNALARKNFLKYSQVESRDTAAIFNGIIRALEDKLYNGTRAKRY